MEQIFYLIYYIAWTLIIPVLYLMAMTFVPKWKPGLKGRLGIIDPNQFITAQTNPLARPIWFHAISVGELNALIPLLSAFMGRPLLLSTGTATAHKMAKEKLEKEIETNAIKLIYMPWDHPYIIAKTLNQIMPSAIILMESEIWPALIIEAYKRKIKVMVINAKLSDSSLRFYKQASWLVAGIFKRLTLVLAQSAQHSRKYIEMKVAKDKVFMTGNIKFAALPDINQDQAREFRSKLGYKDTDIIWVCGSTHPEEESLLVSIFQELQDEIKDLRLVIAPRHPERFNTVESFINSAAKLEPIRYNLIKKLPKETRPRIGSTNDVLLLDTIGDLMDIYSIADIAFVGGTINASVGGHNVLEPACYAVPILIGPHYYKNTEMVDMLEAADALEVTETKEDLRLALRDIAKDANKRVLMGANAKTVVDQNRKILVDVANKIKRELGETI